MITRRLIVPMLTTALLAGLPAVADAQYLAWRPNPLSGGRVTLEGFYAHQRFDTGREGDRLRADGVGGRLMMRLAPLTLDSATLAARTALGAFAVYTPDEDGRGFRTWHAGVQGDVAPFRAPLGGRVEPLLSVGAGLFETELTTPAPRRVAFADRNNTSFAFSPAVGMRLVLYRGFGLRTDLRDVIVYRHGPQHNVEWATGMSLWF